jgi:hypothetical protein
MPRAGADYAWAGTTNKPHRVTGVEVGYPGLELLDLGLKDLVLPGELKALLNRVIEAQETEANVILRREETAATRSMAQTAKVSRRTRCSCTLKELEANELAEKVGQVNLVLDTGVLP